ncbi:MAG: hypothetical protein Q9196_002607 [Gyalolechia fulgens]
MFDYVTQPPTIHRRRHAMKPDEAAFLKQNPPKLDVKALGHKSWSNARYYQGPNGELNQKRPGLSTLEIRQGTNPQDMESGDPSGSSAHAHFHQQQAFSFEGGKSDCSSSSSEAVKSARSDHKRKFGAFSEDGGDINASATAIDIVHPSEIRVDDDGFGRPEPPFQEDYSFQVSYAHCLQNPSIDRGLYIYLCFALRYVLQGIVLNVGLEEKERASTTRTEPKNPRLRRSGHHLTECDDGSYCCGSPATECCAEGRGTSINKSNGQIVISGQISRPVAPATSAASASATEATSRSSSSTTTSPVTAGGVTSPSLPSPSAASSSDNGLSGGTEAGIPIVASSSDNGLSGGTKAGIAIGAVAGVALVAGLLFLLYRERRKRKALQGDAAGGMRQGRIPSEKYPWQTVPGAPVEHYQPQEMDAYDHQDAGYQIRGEMDGQERPREMPGASPRVGVIAG